MNSLVLATRNAHKAREVRDILGNDFEVQDLQAYSDIPGIEETGKTFEENAVIKALAVSARVEGWVIADDSGLEVDLLGGAPGVYSARYSGEGATDQRNNAKLLDELANTCIEQRTARFRCVIALARDNKIVATFPGAVEGRVIDQPRGTTGFGYDPLFVPNGYEQTFGELPIGVKSKISHRAVALAKLVAYFRRDS